MTKKHIGTMIFYGVMAGIIIIRVIGLLNIHRVSGASMEPTYHENDILFSSNLVKYDRGSVVVAKSPDGKMVIKRIIGLPGDKIQIIDDAVIINNEQLYEPYIKPDYCTVPKNGTYDLADDEYFIAGDNRCYSMDSRTYGPVKKENILASIISKPKERSQ